MNQKLEFFASKGYGVFPYIIIREMSGMYRQIPIHFSLQELLKKEGVLVNPSEDDSRETMKAKCIETLSNIIRSKPVITFKRESEENWIFQGNRKREGCVVFSANHAIYLNSEGEIHSKTNSIPLGGSLISMCGEIIRQGDRHYNLL